jgi:LmbE family N-acetylglucosaminyl deacetylase
MEGRGKRLRVLVFGAHPDDCDFKCGGMALRFSELGHTVKFVACTNGGTGHYSQGGLQVARRRHDEAQASAAIAGLDEYQVLDNHCGELEPSVPNRKAMIKIMRDFCPDVITTHRPYDYHPDHRCTSQLVQDASYIITVPNMLPLTASLSRQPVICYMSDPFRKPAPFNPDIVIPIDGVIEKKVQMIHCHESQVYEWMPFNREALDEVPSDDRARLEWLRDTYLPSRWDWHLADEYRSRLVDLCGEEGRKVKYAEAFEICEYGRQLKTDTRSITQYFPFFE